MNKILSSLYETSPALTLVFIVLQMIYTTQFTILKQKNNLLWKHMRVFTLAFTVLIWVFGSLSASNYVATLYAIGFGVGLGTLTQYLFSKMGIGMSKTE